MKNVDIKKVWNFALCLIIFGAVCIYTPVSAQSTAQVFILPEEITVPVGSEIKLELAVAGGRNINAFDVTIYYDSAVMSLLKWEHGGFLSNLAVMLVINEPGILRVAATQLATPAVSGDGKLLDLYFRADVAGTTLAEIDSAEFANSQGVKTFPDRSDGVVFVANIPTFTPTIVRTSTATQTAVPTFTQPPPPTATVPTPSPTFTLIPSASSTPVIDIEATEMAEAFQLGQLTATLSVLQETATLAQTSAWGTEETAAPTEGDDLIGQVEETEPTQAVAEVDEGAGTNLEPAQFGFWESILWGLLIAASIAIFILVVLILKRRKQESESLLL